MDDIINSLYDIIVHISLYIYTSLHIYICPNHFLFFGISWLFHDYPFADLKYHARVIRFFYSTPSFKQKHFQKNFLQKWITTFPRVHLCWDWLQPGGSGGLPPFPTSHAMCEASGGMRMSPLRRPSNLAGLVEVGASKNSDRSQWDFQGPPRT